MEQSVYQLTTGWMPRGRSSSPGIDKIVVRTRSEAHGASSVMGTRGQGLMLATHLQSHIRLHGVVLS
jgi:hypothetical protein